MMDGSSANSARPPAHSSALEAASDGWSAFSRLNQVKRTTAGRLDFRAARAVETECERRIGVQRCAAAGELNGSQIPVAWISKTIWTGRLIWPLGLPGLPGLRRVARRLLSACTARILHSIVLLGGAARSAALRSSLIALPILRRTTLRLLSRLLAGFFVFAAILRHVSRTAALTARVRILL